MNTGTTLRTDGVITLWTLSERTNLAEILARWQAVSPAHGVSDWGVFAPRHRPYTACLKDALRAKYPKQLIRPLRQRDGFAVLQEVKTSDSVDTTQLASFRVDHTTGFTQMATGWDYQAEQEVRQATFEQAALLKPSQISKALVQVLGKLQATAIRPTGGVYWLADQYVDTWVQIAQGVEAANEKNCVYLIRHQFDMDSIRVVRDAILAEAEAESARIIAEIDAGDLGERALRARGREAKRLARKIELFAQILSDPLPAARALAEQAELASTASEILAAAK